MLIWTKVNFERVAQKLKFGKSTFLKKIHQINKLAQYVQFRNTKATYYNYFFYVKSLYTIKLLTRQPQSSCHTPLNLNPKWLLLRKFIHLFNNTESIQRFTLKLPYYRIYIQRYITTISYYYLNLVCSLIIYLSTTIQSRYLLNTRQAPNLNPAKSLQISTLL